MSRGSYDLHLYHFAILLNEKNVFIIKHCIVVLHKEKKKKKQIQTEFFRQLRTQTQVDVTRK